MASDNSPSCRSFFQKTVSLRDWWLIKPETDDGRNTLGVAGVTCTSQHSRAERCFSSAPILKVYDFFELETVDGVCVLLEGYINRDRTLESGFSSEVFDHFVIGFPPHWEELSTSCPKRESTAECVSRVHEEGKDSIEGHRDFHDSTHGKSQDRDRSAVDMGVQDCEDTVLSNKTSTICDAFSLEQNHVIEAGHEVLRERSFLTSEFEDDPSLTMSFMSNDVPSMKHNILRSHHSSKNIKMDVVNPSTTSKCLEVSSRRTTRSMTKTYISKNNSTEGSLLHDISGLDKVIIVDPENLGSSDVPRKDTADALFDINVVNVVVGSYQKGNSSSSCLVKCGSRKNISRSEGNTDEQNMKNIYSNHSVGYDKQSNEAASFSMLRTKSKRNKNDQYAVDVTEDQRNKSTSQVGVFNQKKNEDGDVSGESQIGTRSDLQPQLFKAECSDPLDPLNSTSVGVGRVVNAFARNVDIDSTSIDPKDDIILSKASMKPCRNKKNMTSPRSTKSISRLGLRCPTGTLAEKGSKERYRSSNILSPESFSGKRSRSGRVILPGLEFWRNQTAIYNEDRQVTGIQEGTCFAQLSTDIPKNNKAFKKKGRIARKP